MLAIIARLLYTLSVLLTVVSAACQAPFAVWRTVQERAFAALTANEIFLTDLATYGRFGDEWDSRMQFAGFASGIVAGTDFLKSSGSWQPLQQMLAMDPRALVLINLTVAQPTFSYLPLIDDLRGAVDRAALNVHATASALSQQEISIAALIATMQNVITEVELAEDSIVVQPWSILYPGRSITEISDLGFSLMKLVLGLIFVQFGIAIFRWYKSISPAGSSAVRLRSRPITRRYRKSKVR